MLTLIAALTLVGTAPGPTATLPRCCARAQTIVIAAESHETSHRVGHVVSPAVMTTAFYGAALYAGADRKKARVVSVVLSLAAIISKELYDRSTEARSFSTLDIALGVGGTALGLAAAEAIDWPEER